MPQICQVCGRGTQTSFNVSHAKNKTKRTQKINLQSKRIPGAKIKVCTGCIKTINKK